MKTAMQMVFEKFDKMPTEVFLTYLIVNREGVIEKEKEQIIEACFDGAINYGELNYIPDVKLSSEIYYKEKYQKKNYENKNE